jgi:hypothetical protein
MSERVAVIIVTYQKTEFQKELLAACIKSVTTHMKHASVIVLDDNHSSENLPDVMPAIGLEKTKHPQCGEVNAYVWACEHRSEYDTFVFLHDSTIVLKEIPTVIPDHFRPLWYASKCIRDNLKGGGVEDIMKEFRVKGESCDTIYQALLQNRGSIVFGGMAIFDSVFLKFVAEETNVLELAPRLNTRFLRCFFERLLFMVYSKFGDSNKFNRSALCGDIFNHRDAFHPCKTIRPELAGNPYVLKIWQGR